MKSTILLISSFCFIALCFLSFKDDPDPLYKRAFNISLSETKNGVVAKKVINNKITFKNGRLYCDFLHKKFGFKYIRYRINKDSMYVDFTDTEVRLLEVEASATDKKNQTVFLNFSVIEWDIDGVIKITRNDKLRKYYDLSGREIGGKPKRVRKKKTDPLIEVVY